MNALDLLRALAKQPASLDAYATARGSFAFGTLPGGTETRAIVDRVYARLTPTTASDAAGAIR